MNLLSDPWLPTTTGAVSIIDALENAHSLLLVGSAPELITSLRILLSACYAGGETSSKLLRKGISKKTLNLLERYEDGLDRLLLVQSSD